MTRKLKITMIMALAIWLAGCDNPQAIPPESPASPPLKNAAYRIMLEEQIANRYESPQAHYELGKIFHSEGQWNKAQFHFEVAIRFAPNHWPAKAALVRSIKDAGNGPRAQIIADRFMKEATDIRDLMFLGKAFQTEMLDEYALQCFEHGLRIAPNSAQVHRELGFYYLQKGDQIRAEEFLRRSFSLNRYQPDVARELGKMGVIIQAPRPKKESGSTPPSSAPSQPLPTPTSSAASSGNSMGRIP
ncbi:MAG: hypothetical protein JXA82_14845 [Sedimentisphaerales bacterium]|nr:hypothetical protein [Sedimentisphaerales bacterium]